MSTFWCISRKICKIFASCGLIHNFFDSASAVFVGVYEPAKQKLLRTFPENLSAVAHLVSCTMFAYYLIYISIYLIGN